VIDLAIDFESHLITKGMKAPKLVCGVTWDGSNEVQPKLMARPQMMQAYRELIVRKDVRLVGHNVTYDTGLACAEDPDMIVPTFEAFRDDRIRCTKVRGMLIGNALGELKFEFDEDLQEWKKSRNGLDDYVRRYFKVYLDKKGPGAYHRTRFANLDGLPVEQYPEDARKYVLDDARWPLRCYQHQEMLAAPEGIPGENGQHRATWALHLMSCWGVRTDEEKVDVYERDLERELAGHVKTAQGYGFVRRDGSRDTKKIKALVEQWHRDQGLPVPLTEKGQIAMTRKALRVTEHPGLIAVSEVVRVDKLISTYLPSLVHGTSAPITPNYNPIVESIRTSCNDPNIQNRPRGGRDRECFKARPGKIYIFCDLDTIELVSVAQSCYEMFGYSRLRDAINDNVDPHVLLASEILQMPYTDALARHKNEDLLVGETRQFSKIGNYGFWGGMSAQTFMDYADAQGVKVVLDQARMLHDTFRRTWSEAPEFFRYCSQLIGDGEVCERFELPGTGGMVRGKVRYTALCNTIFQSRVAVAVKKALWRVAWECYVDRTSPLYGCRPWYFGHDEIGLEADDDRRYAHEAALALQRAMQEEVQAAHPDVKVGATANMCRFWYKGCKPTYLGTGQDRMMVPAKASKGSNGKKIWIPDL
jgi:hypothetical protein